MNTDRELMQQALEALENTTPTGFNMESDKRFYAAIDALRERLAQPERCQCPECQITLHASDCAVHNEPAYPKGACSCKAQPEQEPVAEVKLMMTGGNAGIATRIVEIDDPMRERLRPGQMLYTAPPQRKPLTDEEIEACRQQGFAHRGLTASFDFVKAARAVEAKLKENT